MRYYYLLLLVLLLPACSGLSKAEQCKTFQDIVERTPTVKAEQLMTAQDVEKYTEKIQQHLNRLRSIQFSDRVLKDVQQQSVMYYTQEIQLLKEFAIATRDKERDWSPSNHQAFMAKINQLIEADQKALYPTEQSDLKYHQRCR